MPIIVMIGLVIMIITTIRSLANKELMEKHNDSGMFGGLLILILIAEIVGLVWMAQYYFF